MPSRAIFTIVSNNYLHLARTLMQSVAQHHPEAKRYCVVVDADLGPAQALQAQGEFEVLALSQLGLPDGDDFLFQYTVLELNTAVKPWALAHLLAAGHAQAFYIDPDIHLYGPMGEVVDLLDGGHDVVLTPHLLAPMTDALHPSELDIRRAGTYNLGFCAMRDTPNVRNYLHWWQGKLRRDCTVEVDRGIFVDQSWMDLVPGMFERVAVLRHAGYNVAYWNLAQRRVTQDAEGGRRVNGVPLVFFHFSGFNPRKPDVISKHQNRLQRSTLNATEHAIFDHYAQCLIDNGESTYARMRYGWSVYSDGTPISDGERTRFRKDAALRTQCGGRPFDRADLLSGREALAVLQATHASQLQGSNADDARVRQALAALDPAAVFRVNALYSALLGRAPDPAALIARSGRVGTLPSMAWTVLSVGLSAEARRRPGWAGRLLQFVDEVPLTPESLRRWLIRPLRGLLPPAQPAPASTQAIASAAARPTNPSAQAFGLNLVGYPRAELGVGEALRSLARACHAVDVPFSLTDVGEQSPNRQSDDSIVALARNERFAIDMLYVNADQTAATVRTLQQRGHARAPLTLGFWHWEQPELPQRLHAAFAHLNEVWVPSRFVHDAVAPVSPVPVFTVPHALQVRASSDAMRARFGLHEDRMLALVMYDFHSYQYRKNPQAAIAAFRLAARQHPNLGLVIKTINSAQHAQAFAELQQAVSDLPHVHFINDFLSRQQTWDLQACCDVLLSLHRAEGFGLAPAEMMALGKPVIATGWSANMDFMTEANSMPVRHELKPLAFDVGAYAAGPLWAEADVEHAAWCLGQLVQDPALGKRLGSRAAHDIAAQLSLAVVGAKVQARLQLLAQWHQPDSARS
ncbi:MAG: glycosyltransferase family 1 protein [Betaproteobacteria bacterium]|nr:glycosyltransferase family 1 protein [Betaproteobacteria bacterium]